MRRLLFLIMVLALLLLLPPGMAVAQPPGNTPSIQATLNAAATAVEIPLAGQHGAQVYVAAGTLTATGVGECSYNEKATWESVVLSDPTTGLTQTSLGLTNPNDAEVRDIRFVGSPTHCRFRISSYTSGSAVGKGWATTTRPGVVVYLTDGSILQALRLWSAAPGSGDLALPVRCIGCPGGTGGTAKTDDAAFTVGTDSGTPVGGIFKATPDLVDDGDFGVFKMTSLRQLVVVEETPAGDSLHDDALDAKRSTIVSVVTIGGQSASATVTSLTACANQDNFNFSSTTRQQLVALAASAFVKACYMEVWLNGDADVTFYEGTQTTNPCDTSSATLKGPFYVSSTNGRAWISPGAADGVAIATKTAARQLCVGTSAAVSTTVFLRWARF